LEILPCEHCQAQPEREDIKFNANGHAKVVCPKCGHEGKTAYGRTKPSARVQAAAAWNKEMSDGYGD
jgi:hypothetical protein